MKFVPTIYGVEFALCFVDSLLTCEYLDTSPLTDNRIWNALNTINQFIQRYPSHKPKIANFLNIHVKLSRILSHQGLENDPQLITCAIEISLSLIASIKNVESRAVLTDAVKTVIRTQNVS
jgi:hypothetical protein